MTKASFRRAREDVCPAERGRTTLPSEADRFADGPGLSSPALVGLDAAEILARVNPRFVVEHYGEPETTRFGADFVRVRAIPFAAAGVISAQETYSLNLYERRGSRVEPDGR